MESYNIIESGALVTRGQSIN